MTTLPPTMNKKRKTDEGATVEEEKDKDKVSAQRTLAIDKWWIEDYPLYGEYKPIEAPDGKSFFESVPGRPKNTHKFSGYSPMYEHSFDRKLLPWHEVKAGNGILLYPHELRSERNLRLQTYYYGGRAEPTRGNCPICGASGPLLGYCQNGCKDPWESRIRYRDYFGNYEERGEVYDNLAPEKDPLGISRWACKSLTSRYWPILMPNKKAIIDPELWAELFYDMPIYKVKICEYLEAVTPSRRGEVRSDQDKSADEPWSFDGDPRYHWTSGRVEHDTYVLRPEDPKWIQFVKFCEKTQGWGHPYN